MCALCARILESTAIGAVRCNRRRKTPRPHYSDGHEIAPALPSAVSVPTLTSAVLHCTHRATACMRLGCLRLRALLQFPLFILVNFRAVFLQFSQFRLVVCLSGEHQLCCIHYRVSQFSCQSAAIPNRLCRSPQHLCTTLSE